MLKVTRLTEISLPWPGESYFLGYVSFCNYSLPPHKKSFKKLMHDCQPWLDVLSAIAAAAGTVC